MVGVFPLAFNPSRGEAIFPSEVSSYNDLIAESQDDEVIAGILDFTLAHPKPYDRVKLRWVRKSSNLLRGASLIGGAGKRPPFDLEGDYYSFVQLTPSYEQYIESRSRLFRRNVRRARRIAESEGFTIGPLEPSAFPPDVLPDIFLSLHLARFGDASAFRKRPANLAFARMALPRLFERRQILVLALKRGDEIAAIDICLIGHDSVCAWNGGYAPDMERWSPGRILVDEGIRIAFQRGLREFDLLRGPQEWKRSWTNGVRHVGSMEFELGRGMAEHTVA